MSSSNRVRLAMILETIYGTTPPAGDFETIRFTGESLSGEPNVIESTEIRPDRQGSGQVIASISDQGAINFEFSKNDVYKKLFQSAMKSAWTTAFTTAAAVLVIDDTAKTITATAGDFTTNFPVGKLIQLKGFDAAGTNNFKLVKAATVTALVITYIGDLTSETSPNTATLTSPETQVIGTTDYSYTMEKMFMDLTDKAITYTGELVGQLTMDFTFGQIVTGVFTMAGANYVPSNPPLIMPITNGRTVIPPTSETPLNASVDVGLVIIDNEVTDFCIQKLGFDLNNNYRPKNCIGSLTPTGQTVGKAAVGVTLEAYLSNNDFKYLQNKINNLPIEIVYGAYNSAGEGIAVQIPEAQLSFPDPAAAGSDQDVNLTMAGTAKAPAGGGSELIIYWL